MCLPYDSQLNNKHNLEIYFATILFSLLSWLCSASAVKRSTIFPPPHCHFDRFFWFARARAWSPFKARVLLGHTGSRGNVIKYHFPLWPAVAHTSSQWPKPGRKCSNVFYFEHFLAKSVKNTCSNVDDFQFCLPHVSIMPWKCECKKLRDHACDRGHRSISLCGFLYLRINSSKEIKIRIICMRLSLCV